MADVAVIGAGPMGLACAHALVKQGHQVTTYEADRIVGGMSASFDFDGLKIERFYHFICTGDQAYFDSLAELGIEHKLQWVATRMGYYHRGRLKPWGNPLALLRFSDLGLIAKIRYGLLAFSSIQRKNWRKLDSVNAVSWLRAWSGEEGWRELWKPLFELKFFQYVDELSAAWIWARMRRLGQSRRNLMTEHLGFLEGGSDTWLHAIRDAIIAGGGAIRLGRKVDEVLVENGVVHGVRCGDQVILHDRIISTVPLPFVAGMIPALPEQYRRAYRSIDNIAVVCVLVKLRRPLSPYFWLNISDETMAIPGVIEYSNLCPLANSVVYLPYYLPGEHPDYQQPDSFFIERSRAYLETLNPDLDEGDFLTIKVGRYLYAQPICPPRFLERLPPICPGIRGLKVADTSYYYPEDRSISQSIQLGVQLAADPGADE